MIDRAQDKPETLSQARRWEVNRRRYEIDAGLCARCAGQAAWAHQLGWRSIATSPCAGCLPLVVKLPKRTANSDWRALAGPVAVADVRHGDGGTLARQDVPDVQSIGAQGEAA